jgi:carboxypeptidase C (cathepsin A)
LITPPKDELGAILEERDIKVLIMNGDLYLDFHTNYFGTEKLVENLEWYGKEDFNNYNHGSLKRWHFTNTTSGDDHVPGGDIRVLDSLSGVLTHVSKGGTSP